MGKFNSLGQAGLSGLRLQHVKAIRFWAKFVARAVFVLLAPVIFMTLVIGTIAVPDPVRQVILGPSGLFFWPILITCYLACGFLYLPRCRAFLHFADTVAADSEAKGVSEEVLWRQAKFWRRMGAGVILALGLEVVLLFVTFVILVIMGTHS